MRLLLYVIVICGEEVILNDLDADFNSFYSFAHCIRQMDEKWKVVFHFMVSEALCLCLYVSLKHGAEEVMF